MSNSKEIEYDNLMKPIRDNTGLIILMNIGLISTTLFVLRKAILRLKNKNRRLSMKGLYFLMTSGCFQLFVVNYICFRYLTGMRLLDFLSIKKELEYGMIDDIKYDFSTLIEMIDNQDKKL